MQNNFVAASIIILKKKYSFLTSYDKERRSKKKRNDSLEWVSARPTRRRIALFLGAFSLVHSGKKRESPSFRPCNLLPLPRPQNKMKGDGEAFPKMGEIREKKQIPNKCMLESGKYKFQCSKYKFHYSIPTEGKNPSAFRFDG